VLPRARIRPFGDASAPSRHHAWARVNPRTSRSRAGRALLRLGGRAPCLELGQALLQCFELLARLEQHLSLNVEFGARDEIKARETCGKHCAHVLLDVLGRALLDRLSDPGGEIVERLA